MHVTRISIFMIYNCTAKSILVNVKFRIQYLLLTSSQWDPQSVRIYWNEVYKGI